MFGLYHELYDLYMWCVMSVVCAVKLGITFTSVNSSKKSSKI